MNMRYTNEMRQAVHAIKNPTNVPVNVSQKDTQLFIIIERKDMLKLSKKEVADLGAYVKDIRDIIRLGGGGEARTVVI